MTSIHLPWPLPSTNRLYRNYRGRTTLSPEYRAWRSSAGWTLKSQRPEKHIGPVAISIKLTPPDKRKRDLDNFASKAVIDLLASCQIIERDDMSIVRSITIAVCDTGEPGAKITVTPL